MAIKLLRSVGNFEKALKIAQDENLNDLQFTLILDIGDLYYKSEEYIKSYSKFEEILKNSSCSEQ